MLVLSGLFAAASPALAGELKLQLTGLKPKGQVMVILFDAEQAWKAKEGAVREVAAASALRLPRSASRI
jgi:uncharacterized protein (DUF2141 family)